MKVIKKARLSDGVTAAIKEMIKEHNFKAGDKFYSENELVKILGVSRSSIREGVRILEATGYLTVKQGKGIYITDINSQKFEPFIRWLRTNEQSTTDDFEVRLMIEPKAAALAAQHADLNDVAEMEKVLAKFVVDVKNGNTTEIIKSDRAFHRCLAKATKNMTLYALTKSMTTSLLNDWISSLHIKERTKKTIPEHKAILNFIKERDSKGAEKAMERHLKNAMSDIKQHLNRRI